MRVLKKWVPASFRGQMVAIVLFALLLSVLVSVIILGGAYNRVVDSINQTAFFRRVITLVELLEQSPEQLHRSIIQAAHSRYDRVRLSNRSTVKKEGDSELAKNISVNLLDALGESYKGVILVQALKGEEKGESSQEAEWQRKMLHGENSRRFSDRERSHHLKYRKINRQQVAFLNVSIQLHTGLWLNITSSTPPIPRMFLRQTAVFLFLAIVSVLLAVIFMVRRVTEPMRQLAGASHRLGLGEQVDPLPEKGPEDIRETIRAFNLMNERMQRFVSDRTRMLAALSHDLRTPLTTMRLRLEMMPESDDRNQLLATLEEMQQMSEATLAFMRQASDREKSRKVDLNALLDSLCEDFLALGYSAHYEEGVDIAINCRLVSLKRALRNLIENGIKYGEKVEVSTELQDDSVHILIQDYGPGIPEDKMDVVFEPFVRLEASRNRDTGGMGLGMSIARNILHSHGGEVSLAKNKKGLLVTVKLPV